MDSPESEASFSPRGKRLAAARIAGDRTVPTSSGIAVTDLAAGKAHLVTSIDWKSGEDKWPRWSPDGKTIVFYRVELGAGGEVTGSGVWAIGSDGSHLRRLTPPGQVFGDPDWSPDGKTIVLDSGPVDEYPEGGQQLFTMRPDGSDLTPLAITGTAIVGQGATGAAGPCWTPDGTAIVYIALHDFDGELRSVPSTGGLATRLTQPEPGVRHTHPAFRPLVAATK